MYWIALAFVPSGFFKRHQAVSSPILRDRISDAMLVHGEPAMGRGVSTYDPATWRAIRSEIESILGEYGESLDPNE
jgi:hypothetical protein